jgi:hypothetical protein
VHCLSYDKVKLSHVLLLGVQHPVTGRNGQKCNLCIENVVWYIMELVAFLDMSETCISTSVQRCVSRLHPRSSPLLKSCGVFSTHLAMCLDVPWCHIKTTSITPMTLPSQFIKVLRFPMALRWVSGEALHSWFFAGKQSQLQTDQGADAKQSVSWVANKLVYILRQC